MTINEAVSEVFWRALKELPERERKGVVARMIEDEEFMEEMIDIIGKQRLKGPSDSL